jgi:hypothetical protein
MWKGVPPILVGISALFLATWYVVSVVPIVISPNAPDSPPAAMPMLEGPAEAPSTPPADTSEVLDRTPAVNPRLTRANYDRIRGGMTEEQVTALLGDPTEVKIRTNPGEGPTRQIKTIQWIQLTPRATIEVEFIDGRSGTKSTTLSSAASLGQLGRPLTRSLKPTAAALGSANVTRANFDRIENGMTEQQVLAILGPPTGSSTKTGTINDQPFQTRVLVWRQRNASVNITVTLRSEKVSGKNCIQVNALKP